MLIGNSLSQYYPTSTQKGNSGNASSSDFLTVMEEKEKEIQRRTEGVECEETIREIVKEVLGYVSLGRFFPDKVDDVLTPETRYQLTAEEKAYFAEKYDISNMTPSEMDEMLCEMEDMGAITQSERLSVNPYLNQNGEFRHQGVVEKSIFEFLGETEHCYENDPLAFFQEQIKLLKKEIYNCGLEEDKDALKEELEGIEVISNLLNSVFSNSVDSRSRQTLENSIEQQWEQEQMYRQMLLERV